MPERVVSGRQVARRLGVSHTAIQKAERRGRIVREQDGSWDLERVRRDMAATVLSGLSPLAPGPDATPFGRLAVARLALKVEAQRLALDRARGRLIDVRVADARTDEIAGAMRDALLNWPSRVSGLIAAKLGAEPHLVQALLHQHMAQLLTDMADRFEG